MSEHPKTAPADKRKGEKPGYDFKPLATGAGLLLRDKKISRCAQFVYLYLLDRRNGFKAGVKTFPVSVSEISEMTNYADRTVEDALYHLRKEGLIIRVSSIANHGDGVRLYAFYLPVFKYDTINGKRVWSEVKSENHVNSTEKVPLNQRKSSVKSTEKVPLNQRKSSVKSTEKVPLNQQIEQPSNPVVAQPGASVLDCSLDCSLDCILDSSSPGPEKILAVWNKARDFEEEEEKKYLNFFKTGIKEVVKRYNLSESQAVDALIYAIEHPGVSSVGRPGAFPADTPFWFLSHSDGKDAMRKAVAKIRSLSSPENPSPETQQPGQPPTAEQSESASPSHVSPAPAPPPAPPPAPTTEDIIRHNIAPLAGRWNTSFWQNRSEADVIRAAVRGIDAPPGDDEILSIWHQMIANKPLSVLPPRPAPKISATAEDLQRLKSMVDGNGNGGSVGIGKIVGEVLDGFAIGQMGK